MSRPSSSLMPSSVIPTAPLVVAQLDKMEDLALKGAGLMIVDLCNEIENE